MRSEHVCSKYWSTRQTLEADPHQEHERARLVAVRRRDRTQLEIRQAIDITPLDRKTAEHAESQPAADDAGVSDLRPARVGTVAAVGVALQLVRTLRTRI